jgi:hypothetical protein
VEQGMANKRKNQASRQQRRMSVQQIIFIAISIIIILAWLLGSIYSF